MQPIRYFIINKKTQTMHVYGLCPHTKPRNVPIRLFDSKAELENYAGRSLTLCRVCSEAMQKVK